MDYTFSMLVLCFGYADISILLS